MADEFGDRMKSYEKVRTTDRLDSEEVVYARLDGRGFSKFTKGMARPFDHRMSGAMIEVTKHLVESTNAVMGYTQSDEISLVWNNTDPNSQMMFDGKIQKLCSTLASTATAKFIMELLDRDMGDYALRMPTFDCRAFELPDVVEGANAFLWREQDARKNAISMAAHAVFGHKVLQGKNSLDKLTMLAAHGIVFHEYPAFFTRGTFVKRIVVQRPLTPEEYNAIPLKHRPAPWAEVTRSETIALDVPPFNKVFNRDAFIFNNEEPKA